MASGSSQRRTRRRRNGRPVRHKKRPEKSSPPTSSPKGNQQSRAAALADTSVTFADLGLPLTLTQALNAEGFLHPFPIQASAIPHALNGRDVLGRGPTGSGKTFTFGLPIISALMQGFSRPKAPRSVILVPTRELAVQVRSRLEPLAAAAGQRILEAVGGVKISHNIRSLARPVDILVATPGRAQDLVRQRLITLDDVRVVALDEADQMADMGFLPQVTALLKRMPKATQYLLFSATLDGDVKILVDRFMNDPAELSTAPVKANLGTTAHYLVTVSDGADRRNLVVALAQRSTRAIMFVRTKYAVDRLTHTLLKAGVAAVGLHGNKGQFSRTSALEDFVSGTACVLVATDIAARGIDISDVELVVHIDIPAEHKAYIHRAGRTARAGSAGTVVTLAFNDAVEDALTLLKKAGVEPLQLSSEQLLGKIALKKGRR